MLVATGSRAERRGWGGSQGLFLSLGARWVCDGHTPCGGNSPLSMKWLSICSAGGAAINARATRGKRSEQEARSNCDSEMSNLPHNVKAVLWAIYSTCSVLKLKLLKNGPFVQSAGPTVSHRHHCFGFLLHIFWDVRDTELQWAYVKSPDHWDQNKWNNNSLLTTI